MKIAFILNSISGGGIGKVVTTYANELAKDQNLDVYLILLHKDIHFFAINEKIKIIENTCLRNTHSKFYYAFHTFFFLRKTFSENKFDRIVSNGEWINSFVFFTLFGMPGKLFFADHSNPLRSGQVPLPWLEAFTYKRADGVLVLSEAAYDKVKLKYRQKNVHKLMNPVTLLNHRELKKEDIIITIGRLSKEKGQDLIIEAFSRIKNNDWRLQIIGDGPMLTQLKRLAERSGKQEKIEFLGQQRDLENFLSRVKIFVLPSLTENFPLALIEAMSIGLPCVVTECTAWRGKNDFIMDGINGIKVPVNDIKSLSEGIELLINSEDLRKKYSLESLKIRDKFKMDNIISELRKAIDL